MKAKREKSELKSKINLIYNSKLQSNDTEQKIRRKTHNLTHDSDRNDPIDLCIKGFSLRDFKYDRRHSRGKFSLFYRQNFIFNHSVDAEMSLEVIGTRDSRMLASRQFDYSKTSKNDLHRRRTSQFITNLGITVGFGDSSLING